MISDEFLVCGLRFVHMRLPRININRHLNVYVLELITILEKNSRVTKISMGQETEAKDGSGGIPTLYGCPRGRIQTLRRNDFGLIGVKNQGVEGV